MKKVVVCAVLALVVFASCKRREKVKVQQPEESVGTLASVVHAADPNAAVQLIKGFHPIEQNAWRWTMGKFAVALRPPKDAAQKGATLNVKFSIPDPVIAKLKAVTLSAAVGTETVAPETYTKPGEYTYSRNVDAKALASDTVTVEFSLDKFLAAGEVDQRELGVVVSTIGLEAK